MNQLIRKSWSLMGSSSSISSKHTMNAFMNSMDSLHLFQDNTITSNNSNVIGRENGLMLYNFTQKKHEIIKINKLKEIEDETERQTLGVILLYMTHLIKFKDQQSIDHRASAKPHRIPEILDKKFRSMFLDEDDGGKNRGASGPKNDLLISCVLVLSLIVDGFNSDQTDIVDGFNSVQRMIS